VNSVLIIQTISGFTQHQGEWNGVQELRELVLSNLDAYSPLSVRVWYAPHNDNWEHRARQIYMLRERYRGSGDPFAVIVFAYSWGVGEGLRQLALHLARYEISIRHAVICDGVYKHWLFAGNWRALFGDTRIHLKNVDLVDGFYQNVNKPHGREPFVDGGDLGSWNEIHLPHEEMDSAYQWHNRCVEVAKRWVDIIVPNVTDVPENSPGPAFESRLAPPKGS